ncbi:hypothetical protein ACP4OV_016685 [Aristida adscensionis]
MAMSSEQDSEPPEKRCPKPTPPPPVPLVPATDSPVCLGPSEGCRCQPPPPPQHLLSDLGRRRHSPAGAASYSGLHLRVPRPPAVGAVVTAEKNLVAGNNGGLASGRCQAPPPASRSCAAAAVVKNQRPPLSRGSNLFEASPSAKRKAQHQPRVVRQLQRGEEGGILEPHYSASAATVSCPNCVLFHVCSCVHPTGGTLVEGKEKRKRELSSHVLTPLPCADSSPSPFDKFRYTRLADRKDQDHSGCATPQVWRPSAPSLARCSPLGDPKVGRKRVQATSQDGRQLPCADKRRKTAPVPAAGKPKNKKSVSRQKPKKISSPVLTAAEKRLDMYRRLPPDQLVAPRRHTPYNLLQERYAPDPWKVIVVCMLLNRTRGKPIKELVEGFFGRYPDAQTACNANLEGMVEYLRPTGLQLEKAVRIKKFSFSYLNSDWTYVTELHGVGKYAADAYAIFCAGRVTEVQPDDHKLVDYWKYVCNIGEPWEDEDSLFAI